MVAPQQMILCAVTSIKSKESQLGSVYRDTPGPINDKRRHHHSAAYARQL
jgi:hypothetical protein